MPGYPIPTKALKRLFLYKKNKPYKHNHKRDCTSDKKAFPKFQY